MVLLMVPSHSPTPTVLLVDDNSIIHTHGAGDTKIKDHVFHELNGTTEKKNQVQECCWIGEIIAGVL